VTLCVRVFLLNCHITVYSAPRSVDDVIETFPSEIWSELFCVFGKISTCPYNNITLIYRQSHNV